VDRAFSRVIPAVDGNHLIIGDIFSSKEVHNGANVMAVDKQKGTLRWITQVDSHPAAIITGSPFVFEGVAHIGVSSTEETLAPNRIPTIKARISGARGRRYFND
jgi:polyvinyl alcohol dehydrogenase (cytochrome)